MNEIETMFRQREQRKAAAEQEHRQREAARRSWWRTLRTAVAEIVCWEAIIILLCIYAAVGWVASTLAVPGALLALMAGTWRACQYWQLLSK